MTHSCCAACRMRFAPDDGSRLEACPRCDGAIDHRPAAGIVGYHLFEIDDTPVSLPEAIAAAAAHPRPFLRQL